ncbi:uncharacterized protein PADG_11204 [Paracoccidioides brasiliensis Pb18]|uniref:C2H2-type domain-containing protein n=2 Tax=Paracoccidioides brasiliensis TaxID=121759 RepID=A0A0A0HXG9_PARBD|nr:uncharacterized protein PADG_11204 [Paracoccidioides brasiliensis Pb18]KGM92746.1 hypothetical protein PADG_11204 [Paracoccidioides brasiliensis Pb18]ODH40340.1 hypothetical protein ACO22_01656 [Paracoccidioides brasiliensis]ODH48022.1 hypothetical protein GX48_05869 [Paracoccidioides brasiliensis]
MASDKRDPKFKCTFNMCNRSFDTQKQVRKHKMESPDHEYCTRCDLDFEGEKELLAHKLESNRHIVCPVCGEEFKSDGGKNTHFAQFHPANQEMVCTFCSGKFSRAQAYMGHIENDQCTGFSALRYKEQRVEKCLAERGLMIQDPSNASSVDGGVQVSLSDSQEMTTATEISSRKSIDTPGSELGN